MKEFNCEDKLRVCKEEFNLNNKSLKIGVVLDKVFSFYYKDNLEFLEFLGEMIYFSLINDKILLENLDFLYIGGGYLEVFKEELENNILM